MAGVINFDNFWPDLHNPFKILSKILRIFIRMFFCRLTVATPTLTSARAFKTEAKRQSARKDFIVQIGVFKVQLMNKAQLEPCLIYFF